MTHPTPPQSIHSKPLTRLQSIRSFCVSCTGGYYPDIRDCSYHGRRITGDGSSDCHLWPFRSGHGSKGKGGLSKPIRKHCMWCMGGQQAHVRACPSVKCPLHPYRLISRRAAGAIYASTGLAGPLLGVKHETLA